MDNICPGLLCTTLILYSSPKTGLKLNVQVDSRTMNQFDHLHEILALLKSCVKHAWTLSGLRFSVTHTKGKFIPPDNITDFSGAAVAPTGFDPLFWPTPGHKQEATYRICMSTSTNNRARFAPQKRTEIHILGISIHMCCMKLVLATGLLHGMARRRKNEISNCTWSRIKMTWKKQQLFPTLCIMAKKSLWESLVTSLQLEAFFLLFQA